MGGGSWPGQSVGIPAFEQPRRQKSVFRLGLIHRKVAEMTCSEGKCWLRVWLPVGEASSGSKIYGVQAMDL